MLLLLLLRCCCCCCLAPIHIDLFLILNDSNNCQCVVDQQLQQINSLSRSTRQRKREREREKGKGRHLAATCVWQAELQQCLPSQSPKMSNPFRRPKIKCVCKRKIEKRKKEKLKGNCSFHFCWTTQIF